VRDGGLREKKWRIDVGPESLVPLFRSDVANIGIRTLEGGVVDENVDPAKFIDGALNEGPAMVL